MIELAQGLIVAGCIQGFIFSASIFFSKKKKHLSVRFLGFLVLAFSYSNFQYVLPLTGVISPEQMFTFIFLPVASLIPALIYGFVVTFLNPEKKLTKYERLLFLPFPIFLVFALIFKIGKMANYQSPSFEFFFDIIAMDSEEVLAAVLVLVVIIIGLKKTVAAAKKNQVNGLGLVANYVATVSHYFHILDVQYHKRCFL